MARPAFKRWLTRFIPVSVERSTSCLPAASRSFCCSGSGEPGSAGSCDVQHETGPGAALRRIRLRAGSRVYATFLINHFDLFGLRQTWRAFRESCRRVGVRDALLYRIVRHPLYVGWFFTFWCTPTMTLTHLLFAAIALGYILVAIRFEERDLMDVHPEYLSIGAVFRCSCRPCGVRPGASSPRAARP